MSHYARKGYKVSSMDRNAASTHLWTFQKQKNWNDAEKNNPQKLVIVDEGEHGRLALDHSKQQAMRLRGRACARRSAGNRSGGKPSQGALQSRIHVVHIVH